MEDGDFPSRTFELLQRLDCISECLELEDEPRPVPMLELSLPLPWKQNVESESRSRLADKHICSFPRLLLP